MLDFENLFLQTFFIKKLDYEILECFKQKQNYKLKLYI